MLKIEHIGIAVKNLSEANKLFKKLLGNSHYKTEKVESEGVSTSFFQIGDTKIELLESFDDKSPITRFISKRGEGIHHIAIAVKDLNTEIKRLQNEGFEIINTTPVLGADNKKVCFIQPKTTNGVLVELCEECT